MRMPREQVELETAYLGKIYACQVIIGCAGNRNRGWLGRSTWLF
jgi:hypothetical protein